MLPLTPQKRRRRLILRPHSRTCGRAEQVADRAVSIVRQQSRPICESPCSRRFVAKRPFSFTNVRHKGLSCQRAQVDLRGVHQRSDRLSYTLWAPIRAVRSTAPPSVGALIRGRGGPQAAPHARICCKNWAAGFDFAVASCASLTSAQDDARFMKRLCTQKPSRGSRRVFDNLRPWVFWKKKRVVMSCCIESAWRSAPNRIATDSWT